MSDIAILGAGRVGGSLAAKLAQAGHAVTLGIRDPAATEAKWTGPAVKFADPEGATAAAAIIVNATPGEASVELLSALSDNLAGKILIDVANATVRGDDGMPGGLSYPGSSLAEELQKALPSTKVVKTLNTMLFTVMTNPSSVASGPTVFLSGDDAAAKDEVRTLLADLGWAAEQIEDLGGIASARGVEPFILLTPTIIKRHGFAPFALSIAR